MKILILSSAFSGLTQRVLRELTLLGHHVEEHYDLNERILREQLSRFLPDVIVCPFLTQRIPSEVWREYLCLVVHPGIEGDRGPSSLDWAISEGEATWGVTLLQADEEMDAGDIWGTENFPLEKRSKTSIYKREVSATAVKLIKEALTNIESEGFKARPLDYACENVKGELRPLMKQDARAVDWLVDSTETIIRHINAADTNPGVRDSIAGVEVNLYGVIREETLSGEPGEIIAMSHGAICRATVDGAVWIRQIKCRSHTNLPAIKLPASMVLEKILDQEVLGRISKVGNFESSEEVKIDIKGDIAYVYFDFYNGAANTLQCVNLKNRLAILKQSDVKFIVFMGGEDFWSNGIHLNCIEAASDPAFESWQNINAIDDLVLEIINTPNQVTIAALRNNAGAGGAIMALACDEVVIREGVVLNPHYKKMGLYGSEYWTYLLPKRVGEKKAGEIVNACEPLLACEAVKSGMADLLFPEDWKSYHERLEDHCNQMSTQLDLAGFLKLKAEERQRDDKKKPLHAYRTEELARMKQTFYDPNSEYHHARHAFVYKIKAEKMDTLEQNTIATVA